jgi:hypothetical protein
MNVQRLRYRVAALIDQKRIATDGNDRRPQVELWLPDNGTSPSKKTPVLPGTARIRIFDPVRAAAFRADGVEEFESMKRAEVLGGTQRLPDDEGDQQENNDDGNVTVRLGAPFGGGRE